MTVCAFTSFEGEASLVRVAIQPSSTNGLLVESHLMVDKISTSPKSKLSRCVGHLEQDDMRLVDRALAVFLGIDR